MSDGDENSAINARTIRRSAGRAHKETLLGETTQSDPRTVSETPGSDPRPELPVTAPSGDIALEMAQHSAVDPALQAHFLGVYRTVLLCLALAGSLVLLLVSSGEVLDAVLARPILPFSVSIGLFLLMIFVPQVMEEDDRGDDPTAVATALPISVSEVGLLGTALAWGIAAVLLIEPHAAAHSGALLKALAMTTILFCWISRSALAMRLDLKPLQGSFAAVAVPIILTMIGAVAIALLSSPAVLPLAPAGRYVAIIEANASLFVILFSALIAYLTQRIRWTFDDIRRGDETAAHKAMLIDAFLLVACFMCLFAHVLQLTVLLA